MTKNPGAKRASGFKSVWAWFHVSAERNWEPIEIASLAYTIHASSVEKHN